jgi:tRNA(Ile)-lysidine synthase
VRAGQRVVVALSGGLDSMVLLDLLARAASRRGFELRALHVNHQLSPHAARWAAFCRAECKARNIPIKVVRVQVPRRDSLEAQARALRLAAFAAQKADWIATAHHADDQAETVLYRLLRGAGTRGLVGIPVARPLTAGGTGLQLLRPLLAVPRATIADYARRRRLAWVEDESNTDIRHDRNFLRQRVLPLLEERFPQARRTLARAATLAASSVALENSLAQTDAGAAGDRLSVLALQALAPARAENVLRWFIAGRGVPPPSAPRLREALRQLTTARADAGVNVVWGGCALRRHRDAVFLVPVRTVMRDFKVRWTGSRRLVLAALGGTLTMTPARGEGLSAARLRGRRVDVRVRQGGEKLRPAAGRAARSLKNLLQEAGVAPWARDAWPLLYVDGELAAVPGVLTDAAWQARPGEAGLLPGWAPAGPDLLA